MLINASQLTVALLGGDMIDFMSLVLAHRLAKLQPTAIFFMFFPSSVPAAASRAVVFQLNCIFSLTEGNANFFPSENVPIEVFTEYLGSLVIYFVLRINHYAIFYSAFVKYFANQLGMARVNKD